MTTSLSTIVKEYYAILKDDRQISIDVNDKRFIEHLKAENKFSAFVQIGSGDNKFNGEVSMIKEILEIKREPMDSSFYVCSYGVHHHHSEDCNCFEKYQVPAILFRELADIRYNKTPKQLTEEERIDISDSLKQ